MPVGTVVARNLTDGVTVLSSDIKGTHTVEWGALGDPDGNDVQYIPEEIQKSVAFQKALARGVIAIIGDESDPEVTESLMRQVTAYQRRQAGATQEMIDVLEKPKNNDRIMIFCAGPDARGNAGKCGQGVAVIEAQKNDAPPLCSMHKHLAPQFVADTVSADGKTVTKWIRASLGARESQ